VSKLLKGNAFELSEHAEWLRLKNGDKFEKAGELGKTSVFIYPNESGGTMGYFTSDRAEESRE